jgi:hypothetical protein
MTRTTRAASAVVVASVVAVLFGATRPRAEEPVSVHPLADRCELFQPRFLEEPSASACKSCHDGHFASQGSNHPVNIEYAPRAERRRGSMMPLRGAEDVVARGLFLPDGELRCVTCHDGRSRWRYGLAIPAGAVLQPAVNPRDASTYTGDPARREAEVRAAQQSGAYGVKVSPKPLCLICHALD